MWSTGYQTHGGIRRTEYTQDGRHQMPEYARNGKNQKRGNYISIPTRGVFQGK